jgi:hypothetical protein
VRLWQAFCSKRAFSSMGTFGCEGIMIWCEHDVPFSVMLLAIIAAVGLSYLRDLSRVADFLLVPGWQHQLPDIAKISSNHLRQR